MSLITEEIEKAIKELSLSDNEFRKLPDNEAKPLYYELLETFVSGGDRRWWWESFKKGSKFVHFDDNNGFERIIKIVPNSKELVWFIAEEDNLPFFPIYESTPETIVKVIGECYGFEYYIVPKSKQWLLCENHHDNIIGVGKIIESKNSIFSA